MSDGKPRRGARESATGKVTNVFPRTAEIVSLPAPVAPPANLAPPEPVSVLPVSIPAASTPPVAIPPVAMPPVSALPVSTLPVPALLAPMPPASVPQQLAPQPVSAKPVSAKPAEIKPVTTKPATPKAADTWAAMAEAQSVFGRGYEQALSEFTGLATAGMTASRNAALAMLGAKTMSDAIAVSTDFMRKRFDAMIDGTAKLSDIGVKTITDASKPLLSQVRN